MKELDEKLDQLNKKLEAEKKEIEKKTKDLQQAKLDETASSKKKIENFLDTTNLIERIDEVVDWYLGKTDKKREVYKGFIHPKVLYPIWYIDPDEFHHQCHHKWYSGEILYVYAISFHEKLFIDDCDYDKYDNRFDFQRMESLLSLEFFYDQGMAEALWQDNTKISWNGRYRFDSLFFRYDENDEEYETKGMSDDDELIFMLKEKLVMSLGRKD